MSTNPQIVVAQLGSRMSYAVPVLLERADMLQHFYTDSYAGKGCLKLINWMPRCLCPTAARRLRGRSALADEIPASKITAFNKMGLEYYWKIRNARSYSDRNDVYMWAGDTFGRLVIKSGLDGTDVLYTVKSASSLLLEYCHTRGIKTLFDQFIAPKRILYNILAEENQLWPDWEAFDQDSNYELYAEREKQEWQFADLILAPSQFVLDGLIQSGVPREKCVIVPYGIDIGKFSSPQNVKNTSGKLKVLFVGAVGLRKGIQYLLQAAKKLVDAIELSVVGPIMCNREKLFAAKPANTEYTGQVPRIEVCRHFQWADVFCLPSLCEGSAGVTYEALAASLPVICTPNTGSVVRDGVEGYVVPIRDSNAIAEKLKLLASDRELLREMSRNARERAKDYDWPHYGERLVGAIKQLLAGD